MIDQKSFTKDWILKQRKAFPQADPQLIERQIYAFELVGLLAGTKKSFVFKGGTVLSTMDEAKQKIPDKPGIFVFVRCLHPAVFQA